MYEIGSFFRRFFRDNRMGLLNRRDEGKGIFGEIGIREGFTCLEDVVR